jgi:hypothetical protein
MKKDRDLEASEYNLTITVREPGCQDETAHAGHADEGAEICGLSHLFLIY